MMKLKLSLLLIATLALGQAAFATETVKYVYDAKGRLVKTERSGSVNNNAKTEYQHDKADNRKRATTTGAPRS